MRFYKTLKCSFKPEPYLELVQNRNQRCNITRIRTSAHQLEVEVQRYHVPPVPYNDRLCNYCTMQVPGDEVHFLGYCETFLNKLQCLIGKLSSLNENLNSYTIFQQVQSMLCPTSAKAAKLVNKYISIMFKARTNIDQGEHISNLTFPPHVKDFHDCNESLDESFLSATTYEELSSDSFSDID